MKILITGSNGFIGKNLVYNLKYLCAHELLLISKDSDQQSIEQACKECDIVYHLAGVNRPQNENEYTEGNYGFTLTLVNSLKKFNNRCPVVYTSSVQANLDNAYGKSKKACEELLKQYCKESNAKVYIFRLPNIFGKWCIPNYNSVVATFCFNIANNLSIHINGKDTKLNLAYIDDVVNELINILSYESEHMVNFCSIEPVYEVTLGQLANILYGFKESRSNLMIPDMSEGSFTKKLYSTYLSYLPTDKFSYSLKMNEDDRGSFTEILRSSDRGQVSVNITKPGIEKGNHWHNTKVEKFLVVSGRALIQFRKIYSDEIIEYFVSGSKLEVIDIPTGYTHNIINIGNTDLVTFMWCNECFNNNHPDTYYSPVNPKVIEE